MNIFTDISLIDLVRIQPPFAIPFSLVPGGGGIGRPDEPSVTGIPRGDELASVGIGRPDEGSNTGIGRASDQ